VKLLAFMNEYNLFVLNTVSQPTVQDSEVAACVTSIVLSRFRGDYRRGIDW
jgi:hypothetical protein